MKVARSNDGMYLFHCPGCETGHGFDQKWSFNGDMERPTFQPSLLVKGVQPITDEEHDLLMAGEHVDPRPYVCHSFVTDGRIRYLSDCTHHLAGQTIEMEEID